MSWSCPETCPLQVHPLGETCQAGAVSDREASPLVFCPHPIQGRLSLHCTGTPMKETGAWLLTPGWLEGGLVSTGAVGACLGLATRCTPHVPVPPSAGTTALGRNCCAPVGSILDPFPESGSENMLLTALGFCCRY